MFRVDIGWYVDGSGFKCIETVDNLGHNEFCKAEDYAKEYFSDNPVIPNYADAAKVMIINNKNNVVYDECWIEAEDLS